MEENKYTPDVLARLPREELRRMLTEELHKDTEHIDDSFVRLLLTELQARGSDPAFSDDDAVATACEKFRADTEQSPKYKKRWYQSWMLKAASVVLVLGILFFTLPSAAQAGNVQDMLSWWSNSMFQFFVPGQQVRTQPYVYKTDHPGLQEIYDTITALGIAEQIVPRKLSKAFELTELKVLEFLGDTTIHAHLANPKYEMLFSVIVHSNQTMIQHEKTAENISVWDLAGIEHYLISNAEEITVTWVVENIECTVITDCPEEDVYDFIKSIYTLEG